MTATTSTATPSISSTPSTPVAAPGKAQSRVRGLLSFPNPVNEVSARLVATGVVTMSVALLLTQAWWILVPLAFGFVARVASGPRFSPLGIFVTKFLVHRLPFKERMVAGPPKRFAQSIGALFSLTALILHFGFAADGAALVVIGLLTIAASLEAFAGFCLGCWMFGYLMRWGFVPEPVCVACANPGSRSTIR